MARIFRRATIALASISIALPFMSASHAEDLSSFAILAGSAITNTGPSVINGNVGISPGSAVTGFPPGVVTAPYSLHVTDGVASTGQSDLTTAYNILAGRPTTADLTGQDLGGLTLAPGVYNFATASQLTGTVTLDAHGDPNAVFIFNVGSTLTTGSAAAVHLINGAQGANVYFRVGSSATLGAATLFAGKIFALTSITLVTGANISCGAALARNGAVTLDTNTISICPMTVATTGTTTTTGGTTTTTTGGTTTTTTGGTPTTTTGGTTSTPTGTTTVTPPVTTTTGTTATGTTTGTVAGTTAGTPTSTTSTTTTVPTIFVTALGPSPSQNQRAVGQAIDQFAGSGSTVPLTFQVMQGVLPATELAAAYTQAAGEVATGIAPTGIQAMNSFLNLIFDSAFDNDRDVFSGDTTDREMPGIKNLRGTVHAMGYAEEEVADASSPFGTLDRRGFGGLPYRNPWSVWAAGYGGQIQADGNGSLGTHDRSASTYGIAVGAEYRLTPDTKLGFALAGGGSNFGLADGLGGGRSDMAQAAVYARSYFGNAYIMPAVAYAYHDVTTHRDVTIGGDDHLTASFSAQNIAGEIEAGYRFGWFIPYAAVGLQAFYTPSYSEQTGAADPSVFALSAASNSTLTARTQLGFRIDQDIAFSDGIGLRLRTRAAWAHDTSNDPKINLAFQSMPGSIFTVYGASRAADSFLFSAGPEVYFGRGLSLAAAFDGQVAPNYQAYYGSAQLRYVW